MVKVKSFNGRLYLLGQFPHKDGSEGLRQYKVTLQLQDVPGNWPKAEKRAALCNKQLAAGTFAWEDWSVTLSAQPKQRTWGSAVDALYRKKVTLGRTSQKTWDVSYLGLLKQVDLSSRLTTKSMAEMIGKYERDQASYKHLYYLLKHISQISGVPLPELGLPVYSNTKKIKVPTRQEILDWVLGAPQPYRWYLGMIATYGLRPHEVDRLDQIDNDLVQVWNETKTGFRTVIPLEPEWVELFGLKDKQQRPLSSREDQRPDACSQWLYKQNLKQKITYKTYALRHAFAARLWEMGGSEMDVYTAAMLMGHTVKEHLSTYRAHIDPNTIAAAAQAAITRHRARLH